MSEKKGERLTKRRTMADNPGLWEVRRLPDGLTLELWGGGNPALVLVQGKRRARVNLPHVKGVVAALNDSLALEEKANLRWNVLGNLQEISP